MSYFHGEAARGDPDDPSAEPLYERALTLTADTEMFADPQAAGFRLLNDPALAESLRARLVPHHFRRQRDGDAGYVLAGEIEARRLPSGVSFDVFARAAGREYFAGTVAVNRNRFTRHAMRAAPFPADPAAPVDLVFRTNPKAARLTVDVEEAWNGELVVPAVPVKDES